MSRAPSSDESSPRSPSPSDGERTLNLRQRLWVSMSRLIAKRLNKRETWL